jgi:hypothetical protein
VVWLRCGFSSSGDPALCAPVFIKAVPPLFWAESCSALIAQPVESRKKTNVCYLGSMKAAAPLFVLIFVLLVVWRAQPSAINFFVIATLYRPQPHQDLGRVETADSRLPVMTKSRGPTWGRSNHPESSLVKPPKHDTRALSPAGIFGGKAALHLAAQKSRQHAPLAPKQSTPACILCKWGV